MNYKYTLEKYAGPSTRYTCPQCGVKRTFTRYIDTVTNQHLSAEVGRCNREQKCGYHYSPKQYFEDNNLTMPDTPRHVERSEPSLNNSTEAQELTHSNPLETTTNDQPSTIPVSTMQESFTQYDCNHFVHYLKELLGDKAAARVVKKYHIGTSNYWDCSTVFWQVDAQGRVRTGKVMLYNPKTGRRIKTPQNYINWMHSIHRYTDYNLQQCLFGEHLLKGNSMDVALVESEKTAVLASVLFPKYTWLATGGLSNIGADRLSVLKGHRVFLFPDIGAADKWAPIQKMFGWSSVSYLLERQLNLLNSGDDMEDWLRAG